MQFPHATYTELISCAALIAHRLTSSPIITIWKNMTPFSSHSHPFPETYNTFLVLKLVVGLLNSERNKDKINRLINFWRRGNNASRINCCWNQSLCVQSNITVFQCNFITTVWTGCITCPNINILTKDI